MKKINIFGLLVALLCLAGCDYNEDNFGELSPTITDKVTAELAYDGSKYPAAGYFSDKTAVETAMNDFLKKKYTFCEAGSTAKVSDVLFGDVTPGFAAADAKYTLTDDDYVAMGTDAGQPGKYKNFDANMDIDAYLEAFCTTKYASMANGKVVSITYKFYASGAGTTTQVRSYKKEGGNWVPVQLQAYAADINYVMVGADTNYSLKDDDYVSMGTGAGEPGKFKNFDSSMNVDQYLATFCTTKYASSAVGSIVCVTYKYYAAGVTTDQFKYLKKMPATWTVIDFISDYRAMGTESGRPGRYDNFDANMDIDLYLTTFLKQKYPYTAAGKTAEVTYKYYASGVTSAPSRIYKYDGGVWTAFNPYADVVAVSAKIAEMAYDGKVWTLKRLLGGSTGYKLEPADYAELVAWVKKNKPEYASTNSPTEEFYFGAAAGTYNNINNNYNTWRNYYNIGGAYTGKSDGDMQVIMDTRIAEGIAVVILPKNIATPDPGISYVVTYAVYGGRATGNYSMNFMFNQDTNKYERVSDPVTAK